MCTSELCQEALSNYTCIVLLYVILFVAHSIWETGCTSDNPSTFSSAMEDSDLSEFGFTESFIFDLWGAIYNAKQGRLKKVQNFKEQF